MAGSDQRNEAARQALAAFQMKYRPSRYDGMPDAETAAILICSIRARLPIHDCGHGWPAPGN